MAKINSETPNYKTLFFKPQIHKIIKGEKMITTQKTKTGP